MKTIFSITGHTNAGNYVCTAWFSTAEDTYKDFIKRYPRFKGAARLSTTDASNNVGILTAYRPWVTVNTFESAKQAKTLAGV